MPVIKYIVALTEGGRSFGKALGQYPESEKV